MIRVEQNKERDKTSRRRSHRVLNILHRCAGGPFVKRFRSSVSLTSSSTSPSAPPAPPPSSPSETPAQSPPETKTREHADALEGVKDDVELLSCSSYFTVHIF